MSFESHGHESIEEAFADLQLQAEQMKASFPKVVRYVLLEAVDRLEEHAANKIAEGELTEEEVRKFAKMLQEGFLSIRLEDIGDWLDLQIIEGDPIFAERTQGLFDIVRQVIVMKEVPDPPFVQQVSTDEAFPEEAPIIDELPPEIEVSIKFPGESAVSFGLPADTKPEDVRLQTQGALTALLAERQNEVE